MKDIRKLIDFLEPKQVVGLNYGHFSSVCYNSRKCEPYSLFVAIPGTKVDGHNFINEAIEKGAKYIICEKLPEIIHPEVTYFLVNNSRIALAQASNFWFGFPTHNLDIVGVTGTNGKTTVTYLLQEIMRFDGRNPAVIGTIGAFADSYSKLLNNTTPESYELFKIFKELKDLGVNFVAMEVSSHSLHQNRVFGIDFKGAIFTNLSQDHLDYHKDMNDYASAKSLLFKMLSNDAIVVANADDPYFPLVVCETKATRRYNVGRNDDSDVKIANEILALGRSMFELQFKTRDLAINSLFLTTKLIGRFNIDNVALASTMALALGVGSQKIQNAMESFKGVPGRMQRIELSNGALGIVDYSHTPDALKKALETCREILNFENPLGKLICVFGCGGERDPDKRPKMGQIASELSDFVVITNDNPRKEDPAKIINQIYSGISREGKRKVIQISNRDEAIDYAYKLSRKGDIILVAGKGHEDYQIIGDVKYHFSDLEQLQKYSTDAK
ncbi:MAG: UDP-N-acetylmuramoyl-L-alanyl-D-glutamate--2,6-diaminopimelate ligase [Ignavibacteria bacterium]|nr:UDP-N-acetylmuramoyl-L-alanyl-D-glutamate--2,6-diaminopimelate ligase [Ignavibacteria bacterium]